MSDSDEYDEENETESEEEEPLLKYNRLAGPGITEMFKRYAATCMACHDKFLAIGTNLGVVYLIDFVGSEIRRFINHSAPVNQISIDMDGEHIGSCSNDGTVAVVSLYSESKSTTQNYKYPITSLCLDPKYSKTKEYICGGSQGEIVHHSKGFFGSKDTLIRSGVGGGGGVRGSGGGGGVGQSNSVNSILWYSGSKFPGHSLVAVSQGHQVSVFSKSNSLFKTIGTLSHPQPNEYNTKRCFLSWDEKNIIIGWLDMIQIGRAVINSDESSLILLHEFKTDYIVSGISSFDSFENKIIVLSYPSNKHTNHHHNEDVEGADVIDEEVDEEEEENFNEIDENNDNKRPQLHVITYDNVEVSVDGLGISEHSKLNPFDYKLSKLPSERLFFVVTPKDIIQVQQIDLNERIKWLMVNQKYEKIKEIMEDKNFGASSTSLLLNNKNLPSLSLVDKLLYEKYIKKSYYKKASSILINSTTLKSNLKMWENALVHFLNSNELNVLLDMMLHYSGSLSVDVFDHVLNRLINHDMAVIVLDLLDVWPKTVYNNEKLSKIVTEKITEKERSKNGSNDGYDELSEHHINTLKTVLSKINGDPVNKVEPPKDTTEPLIDSSNHGDEDIQCIDSDVAKLQVDSDNTKFTIVCQEPEHPTESQATDLIPGNQQDQQPEDVELKLCNQQPEDVELKLCNQPDDTLVITLVSMDDKINTNITPTPSDITTTESQSEISKHFDDIIMASPTSLVTPSPSDSATTDNQSGSTTTTESTSLFDQMIMGVSTSSTSSTIEDHNLNTSSSSSSIDGVDNLQLVDAFESSLKSSSSECTQEEGTTSVESSLENSEDSNTSISSEDHNEVQKSSEPLFIIESV
eukprot:TRINITY_DN3566_c0_g1_i2.p1 TRINITY_DN3566_c0_g1~~TRINITY_DN3566_c0_g1_i2.p1  ORF type:complete len:859 (-),score=245.34 TRINITY_DN3566_c0_g1_i2:85-2661(-)